MGLGSRIAKVVLALVLVLGARGATAQEITTNLAVERLFTSPIINSEWFTPEFLAQVPVAQLTEIISDFEVHYGQVVSVTGSGAQLVTQLERATMDTAITLDPNGRISGLFFTTPVPIGQTIADYVEQISRLPGETAVLVMTGDEVVASYQPDLPLGIASGFKILVALALQDMIERGEIALDDVVPLEAGWRSLPSGILQDWPVGTPVTIGTLAALMISDSDNTAADALADIVGRDTLEAMSPRNTPFLTTSELFKLKGQGNASLFAAYEDADVAGRRAILDRLNTVDLPRRLGAPRPTVEWFFSPAEICALLEDTYGMEAFRINAGVADEDDWARFSFKGGSEPGSLSLSTLVTGDDGVTHCIVAIWNDNADQDTDRFYPPYSAIIEALAAGD